jgi:hypothetical protein
MSNFMKISPVGATLKNADRQTEEQADITKLSGACYDYVNELKNGQL